jgi:hypothetical protein
VLIASIRLLFTALAFVAARPVRLGRLSIDLVIFAPVFLMAKPSFAGITSPPAQRVGIKYAPGCCGGHRSCPLRRLRLSTLSILEV